MLENRDALGLTNARNRKKPKRPDVVDWCQEAWETLSAEMIKENAGKMLMTADLGPEVPDYVEDEQTESESEESETEESS